MCGSVTWWSKPDRTSTVATCIIHKTTATLIGFAEWCGSTLWYDVNRVQVTEVQVDLKNIRQLTLIFLINCGSEISK